MFAAVIRRAANASVPLQRAGLPRLSQQVPAMQRSFVLMPGQNRTLNDVVRSTETDWRPSGVTGGQVRLDRFMMEPTNRIIEIWRQVKYAPLPPAADHWLAVSRGQGGHHSSRYTSKQVRHLRQANERMVQRPHCAHP